MTEKAEVDDLVRHFLNAEKVIVELSNSGAFGAGSRSVERDNPAVSKQSPLAFSGWQVLLHHSLETVEVPVDLVLQGIHDNGSPRAATNRNTRRITTANANMAPILQPDRLRDEHSFDDRLHQHATGHRHADDRTALV